MLDIEPVSGTVRVGPAEALDVDEITAARPVWTGLAEPPDGPVEAEVQLRAHGETYPATCHADGDTVVIKLSVPARGVARGQAAVLYAGDTVLGSATITSASPAGRVRAHQDS